MPDQVVIVIVFFFHYLFVMTLSANMKQCYDLMYYISYITMNISDVSHYEGCAFTKLLTNFWSAANS